MSRVVVIGAGAGGLAAAARLAVKGHRVTVLEQAPAFGGKLARFERDGFVFDTGPSLFTLPAVYRDLFLKTGGPLEEAVDLQAVDPSFAYHWADSSTAVLPGVNPARCADALGDALGGQAAAQWRALIQRGGAMWQVTREPFLQSPLAGWRTLMGLARNASDITTVAPFTTLRSLGTSTFADPRLVTLLDRYATYSGSDPRRAPAVLATIPYMEQTFGAWHIGGGLSRLADALVLRCQERGVDLRAGSPVTRIGLRDGRIAGVEVDGTQWLDADIVVANADASQVYGRLAAADPRARSAARALERTTPSLAGFVILAAVRGATPGLQHHNVWFPADYDAEFDQVFGRQAQPVADPAIYACTPADPQMRPDAGHESWFILVNAPRHGDGSSGTVDWDVPGRADAYARHLLDLLAARGTDIRDRILWTQVRTPADLERMARAPGGSIYGTSSNGPRAAFQRPANQSPIPGLYLVGGSSHPGGGLPLVGMSAEIVAGLIGRARAQDG
ncbi:MAG: phytoene desaturase [Actinomycetales bacterium]|nr:phytoene desaturase [Actinomycetales bacterium]